MGATTADDDGRRWYELSLFQGVLLGVALLFLAGTAGYMLRGPDDPGAGSAEVGFVRDMIIHHEQAVEMASVLVDSEAEPQVHIYAHDILLAQQFELGQMDGFLSRWGQPRPTGEGQAMVWMDMPVPIKRMPGLASDEEMEKFEDATGRDKDAWFLRLMTKHHRGGVHMAEAAVERAGDRDLREFASKVAKAQRSEIAEMEETRKQLGLDP